MPAAKGTLEIPNVAALPGAPQVGQVVFLTTTKRHMTWTGISWITGAVDVQLFYPKRITRADAAVVQEASNSAATNIPIVFGTVPVAGNKLVFFATWGSGLGTITPPVGVTAKADNVPPYSGAPFGMGVYYRDVVAGDSATWTFTTAGGAVASIVGYELTHILAGDCFDMNPVFAGGATSPTVDGQSSVLTTWQGEGGIAFEFLGQLSYVAATTGGPWTNLFGNGIGGQVGCFVASMANTSLTGSLSSAWTSATGTWLGCVVVAIPAVLGTVAAAVGSVGPFNQNASPVTPVTMAWMGAQVNTTATAVVCTYPGGIVAGQTIYLLVSTASVVTAFTLATPAGWTLATSISEGAAHCAVALYYKVATGAEAGSFNVAATYSAAYITQMFALSGVGATTKAFSTSITGGSTVAGNLSLILASEDVTSLTGNTYTLCVAQSTNAGSAATWSAEAWTTLPNQASTEWKDNAGQLVYFTTSTQVVSASTTFTATSTANTGWAGIAFSVSEAAQVLNVAVGGNYYSTYTYPAAVAAGDCAVMFVTTPTATTAQTPGVGQAIPGWTPVLAQAYNGATGLYVYFRTCTGTEGGTSASFISTYAGTILWTTCIVTFKNVDISDLLGMTQVTGPNAGNPVGYMEYGGPGPIAGITAVNNAVVQISSVNNWSPSRTALVVSAMATGNNMRGPVAASVAAPWTMVVNLHGLCVSVATIPCNTGYVTIPAYTWPTGLGQPTMSSAMWDFIEAEQAQTWTAPANGVVTTIITIGGGAGGQAGITSTAATGSGGGAGGYSTVTLPTVLLPSTVPVLAGHAGFSGQAQKNVGIAMGGSGRGSRFGTVIRSGPGQSLTPTSTSTSSGGIGMNPGGTGLGTTGPSSPNYAPSGGFTPNSIGWPVLLTDNARAPIGARGSSNGLIGSGGGGGSYTLNAMGGDGGPGGDFGAGGGPGGYVSNGELQTPGSGGPGGRGCVLVLTTLN